jgi:ubiquinone/menaquinone biosynthesis C-methylase UbiE
MKASPDDSGAAALSEVRQVKAGYDLPASVESMPSVRGWLGLARLRTDLMTLLPTAPAVVGDVGGGNGVHARWLMARGYHVRLVDLSEVQVAAAAVQGLDATVADARLLPWADASVDAVLLLGPLYHLMQRSDRVAALRECHRVLKPGGMICAEGLSRTAIFVRLLSNESIGVAAAATAVTEIVAQGRMRTATEELAWTKTAYFHQPDELSNELATAGFEDIRTRALEGPLGQLPQTRVITSSTRAAEILRCVTLTAGDPEMVVGSPHFIAVGTKQ